MMAVDILIFAVIAAILVMKLRSVLGTRHGEERMRRNPFDDEAAAPGANDESPVIDGEFAAAPLPVAEIDAQYIHPDHNQDGRIETGLLAIAAAGRGFDVNAFMKGATAAFEMIVTAYAEGDTATLEPLVSPRLYADFKAGIAAREAAGHKSEVTIERFKSARITEAHLGGVMAYVTVDFDVDETAVTRDAAGNVVDGDPDKLFSVEDIWTFSRDVRSTDPNWILIETRTVEK